MRDFVRHGGLTLPARLFGAMTGAMLVVLLVALCVSAVGADQSTSMPIVESFDQDAGKRWQPFFGKWDFADGAARQSASDFDCGATLRETKPAGAFYLAIRFRPESAFVGGGLFFGLPSPDKKNGGMLVRCDPGGRILWGRFDAGGTFGYDADASYDADGDPETELAVAVDPERQAFNIYLNGQRVATNIRTLHSSGFVGIQSSGGPHRFTRFELRAARPEELAGLKPPGPYSQIVDVVGDDQRIVALRRGPELLTVYDAGGTRQSGLPASDVPGQRPDSADVTPVGLAWDVPPAAGQPAGLLVLVDDGATIWRAGADLKLLGPGPFIHDGRMQGKGLAVDAGGRVFVSDEALPGVRVFDADGTLLTSFGTRGDVNPYAALDPNTAGRFKQPRGLAISPNGELIVLDRGNHTYGRYRFDAAAKQFEWLGLGPWLPQIESGRFDGRGRLLLAGAHEYYHASGALRVLNAQTGLSINVFVGHAVGDLSDRVRACAGPSGRYYLADPGQDRVLVLPADFVEKLPAFAWTEDGGVRLTMERTDGTAVFSIGHDRTADGSRVIVRQTEPTCSVWPPLEPGDSRSYELPLPPRAGKSYVIDMPVLVALFTLAKDEKGKSLRLDGDPNAVVARLARELEVERRFYWLSSRATLNQQFSFLVVEGVEARVDGGWIPPAEARRLVNRVRQERGLARLDESQSLVGIYPHAGFDPQTTDDRGFVGGGGLTTFAYSGYALWNHGQGWLMGHEWGHQLDGYFERSGFTDWWLNHPDATVHVGRYGEHWDCNAFLCRRADAMNWLRLKFGALRLTDDADADGLPDDDPTLPIDEKRFGSDPARKDTDGDGLDDLAEMCSGTFTSSDPTRRDTDGDGVPDDRDLYPAFAVRTTIPQRGARSDDDLRSGGAPGDAAGYVGTIRSSWADAAVGVFHAENALTFVVQLSRPAREVYLPVDFNNDGWFAGRDQVYGHVSLDWPADGQPRLRRAAGCEATVGSTDRGEAVVVARVDRPANRAPLAPRSAVGVCLRLENGEGTIAFLADPWQLVSLELVGP